MRRYEMADVGYLIDLSGVQLDDQNMSWIQAFPYGKYDHPVYGEIEFDPTKAQAVAENFAQNVRGTEIDVDYDHKAHGGEAAGWVRKAEPRTDGLYIAVEWTKKAAQKIKDKEYKYFSPEFADEWKHPKTGEVIKNVLFGGGITNRPFLKDILPLNMSELGMPSERPQEGSRMDPEKIRELLGLPKDATDEQVETALKERKPEDKPEDKKTPEELAAEAEAAKGGSGDGTPETIAASDLGLTAEVIQLAEKSPAIKSLVEAVQALGTQLSATQTALRLTEVESTVKELTEGPNALPAVKAEELKKFLSETDPKVAASVVSLLSGIKETGLVQLGETGRGAGAGEGPDGKDATKRFSDEVAKVMASDKLDYASAAERVASLQPELYTEYTQAAYSFKEN
jgi:phage I-like protein